jgi:hypothetical protein
LKDGFGATFWAWKRWTASWCLQTPVFELRAAGQVQAVAST